MAVISPVITLLPLLFRHLYIIRQYFKEGYLQWIVKLVTERRYHDRNGTSGSGTGYPKIPFHSYIYSLGIEIEVVMCIIFLL
jgi:hypothetical protein